MKRLLFSVLVMLAAQLVSVSAAVTIEDLRLEDAPDEQAVIIPLSQGEKPLTLLDSGSGWLRLDIKDARFIGTEKQIAGEKGFVSVINTFQIGNDVLLEVQFADVFFAPKPGNILLESFADRLVLRISPKDKFAGKAQSLPSDISVAQKFAEASGDALSPLAAAPDQSTANAAAANVTDFSYDFGANVFNMLSGLLIVLLLGYLCLYVLNRFGFKKFAVPHDKYRISVLSTKMLGQKQKILVIDINGKKFACGVTKDRINYLTLVPEAMQSELATLINDPRMTVAALRTVFLKRREAMQANAKDTAAAEQMIGDIQNAPSVGAKKASFRDEFMSKVNSLKKIK